MRALVVDDSTIFRKVVRDALDGMPGVEVVGVAANGKQALERIEAHRPDIVTLDVEMPELDGIGVLQALAGRADAPAVVMVSAHTPSGAEATTTALALGAFDFILKPSGESIAANQERLRSSLAPIVTSLRESAARSSIRSESTRPAAARTPERYSGSPRGGVPPSLIVIGSSTGGPAALGSVLPKLPVGLPPILIAQHMPPTFTRSLAEQLDRACNLTVVEGQDDQECRPGSVMIAPGGKQMGVKRDAAGFRLSVNEDPPERNCRPSVDYLFRSAAATAGGRCLATVLTGMGDDGLEGCGVLSGLGAQIVVQDEATSVVYGMPRAVAEASLADEVLPLNRIADTITAVCKLEEAPCR